MRQTFAIIVSAAMLAAAPAIAQDAPQDAVEGMTRPRTLGCRPSSPRPRSKDSTSPSQWRARRSRPRRRIPRSCTRCAPTMPTIRKPDRRLGRGRGLFRHGRRSERLLARLGATPIRTHRTPEAVISDISFPKATRDHAERRQALSPEANDAFKAFTKAVLAEGALDTRTKQLIAVAVAHVTQCPWCIEAHVKAARREGASAEQIMEAVWVAAEMRAGAAFAHSAKTMKLLNAADERQPPARGPERAPARWRKAHHRRAAAGRSLLAARRR